MLSQQPLDSNATSGSRFRTGHPKPTDAFLLWHLTGGEAWASDVATASRTALWALDGRDWDPELCALFGVPAAALPPVLANASERGVAVVGGERLPVLAAAVDQQAALFGHNALEAGDLKITYGTGAFVLGQLGATARRAPGVLLTTVAWELGEGRRFAFDGGVFTAGAAVDWAMRLGLLATASESAALARAARPDDALFVPALQGLGAPHWDGGARGLFVGLSLNTGSAEAVRAILDGIALRVGDVVRAMADAGMAVGRVRVDGGPAGNPYLMQCQADVLQARVEVADVEDAAALGVALMARLAAGDPGSPPPRPPRAVYVPDMAPLARDALCERWREAVRLARAWHP